MAINNIKVPNVNVTLIIYELALNLFINLTL